MLITLVVTQALIRFSGPAEPAARLLPKLGAAAGLRLEADRRAGQQVLLVNVNGIKKDRLLGLIAEVTGGAWQKVEGGFKLAIDQGQMNGLWKTETSTRTGWLGAAIKSQLPNGNPLALAAESVGIANLASIRPGRRVVWSTSATSLQGPASGRILDIAKELVAQQAKEVEALERRGANVDGQRALLSDPVTTVLFIARRGSHASSLGLAIAAYGLKGQTLARKATEINSPAPPPRPEIAVSGPVAVSAEARGWAAHQLRGRPISDAAFNLLLRPDTVEPLGLGVGGAIAAYAGTAKADVVACLPDRAYEPTAQLLFRDLPAEKWQPWLAGMGMKVRLEEGTLVVSPADPAHCVEDRADRTTMRRQVEALTTHGGLPSNFPRPSGLEAEYLFAVDSSYRAEIEEDGARMLLGPWWTLSPHERGLALNGGVAASPAFLKELRQVMEDPDSASEQEFGTGLAMEPTVFFAPERMAKWLINATVDDQESAVILEPGARIPYPADLASIASALGSPSSGARMMNPKTRFWTARTSKLKITMMTAGPQLFRFEGSVSETVRTSPQVWTYPNLFPALQKAIRGAG